ncbi:MAG: amino acid permease [Halobacteria archaeon]|nr:amino acid permease [Halobacteria archaeon]
MADRSGVSSGIEEELNRDIGIVGAVAIGVGTMIAAGIFVLSGLAVSNVGAMAIVSFLIAAVVAGFTAAAYAEFASIYPESGGGYAYVANVFDTDLTYIVGWSMILGYPASAAFYLASFSDWFFQFMYPALNIPQALPYWIPGILVLILIVGVNIKGTEETGLFQIVVTAVKVGLILLFLYGGLQAFDASAITTSFAENVDKFQQIGLTSALVFITFFGFEAIATNAEEIEKPGTNVPRAIFISMGAVTLIYTLVVLVIVLSVQNTDFLTFLIGQVEQVTSIDEAINYIAENGEISMGIAAEYYLGNIGFFIIIVGALFSMVSAANATVMAGSRVKLAMSRRNHLPDMFEDLHSSLDTPYKAVLLTGGYILFFIVVFSVIFGEVPGPTEAHPPFGLHLGVEAIAHFADFMLLGGLIFVNIAIIQSRRKYPDQDRGFEVPFVPWIPIIAVLANLALLVNVEPKSFILGVTAELVGVAFWFAWKSRAPSVEKIERETPTVVAEHTVSDRDYEIKVPIANPEHVDQLMRTAIDLARENDGEIHVLSVVTIPEQTPLSEGRVYADERRPVINRAMEIAEEEDIPVSGTIRIGHHAGEAILNSIKQHESDAVLMGWKGKRARRRDVVLGSTVDKVVTDADCDVFVEKIGMPTDKIDSILLPTAGGPHAELAAELAKAISHSRGAKVHVVHVTQPDATKGEKERAEKLMEKANEILEDVDVEAETLTGDDVVETIVKETNKHDITVIGATREGLIQRFVFGAIPEEVGEKASHTVIMAKKDLEITSRLRRWFRWR